MRDPVSCAFNPIICVCKVREQQTYNDCKKFSQSSLPDWAVQGRWEVPWQLSPMQDRRSCNVLIFSDDHTDVPSVFIMHVIYRLSVCRLSKSILSSEFCMEVWGRRFAWKFWKNIIKYHVCNPTSANSTIYDCTFGVQKFNVATN